MSRGSHGKWLLSSRHRDRQLRVARRLNPSNVEYFGYHAAFSERFSFAVVNGIIGVLVHDPKGLQPSHVGEPWLLLHGAEGGIPCWRPPFSLGGRTQ